MNVLKPNKKNAITVLLANNLSQHEICRKTGIDRKTIRKYAAILANEDSQSKSPIINEAAAGRIDGVNQNPPPRPPENNQAFENDLKIPVHAKSACKPHQGVLRRSYRFSIEYLTNVFTALSGFVTRVYPLAANGDCKSPWSMRRFSFSH